MLWTRNEKKLPSKGNCIITDIFRVSSFFDIIVECMQSLFCVGMRCVGSLFKSGAYKSESLAR